MVVSLNGKELVWQIRECMASAGIKSVTELHRRLKVIDADAVSYSQLAAMVDEMPCRMPMRTLLGLAQVCECHIWDLIAVREVKIYTEGVQNARLQ